MCVYTLYHIFELKYENAQVAEKLIKILKEKQMRENIIECFKENGNNEIVFSNLYHGRVHYLNYCLLNLVIALIAYKRRFYLSIERVSALNFL